MLEWSYEPRIHVQKYIQRTENRKLTISRSVFIIALFSVVKKMKSAQTSPIDECISKM